MPKTTYKNEHSAILIGHLRKRAVISHSKPTNKKPARRPATVESIIRSTLLGQILVDSLGS